MKTYGKELDTLSNILYHVVGIVCQKTNACATELDLKKYVNDEVAKSAKNFSCFGGLLEKMADLLVLSKSSSTNIKYLSYFKKWEQFITSNGGSAMPASPIHVALFLTDLIDKKASYSVISATAYSIKWVHSLHNQINPTNNSYVTNLLETATRICSKPVNKKGASNF